MPLYFITANVKKFDEVKLLMPDIEQLEIDLPEIQENDAKKIIKAKLLEALGNHKGEFMVEDTSFYLDCLNGLPGPLIKWFLVTVGNIGLADIAHKFGNYKATAKTIIGYAKNHGEIYFFEGALEGEIVVPTGDAGFGWDPIFKPSGHAKVFGEMTKEEKNAISMRSVAVAKLKEFLAK
ncbi:MAG: non-canonical purine NTP pyrophosphatase [bacterium]|nr:non-canonical purine NTP pyrophosphatase [bacterium]